MRQSKKHLSFPKGRTIILRRKITVKLKLETLQTAFSILIQENHQQFYVTPLL